jgi:ubiquitin carboxyl-terminal hydrolase 7
VYIRESELSEVLHTVILLSSWWGNYYKRKGLRIGRSSRKPNTTCRCIVTKNQFCGHQGNDIYHEEKAKSTNNSSLPEFIQSPPRPWDFHRSNLVWPVQSRSNGTK